MIIRRFTLFALLCAVPFHAVLAADRSSSGRSGSGVEISSFRIPPTFEKNDGQWPSDILFRARGAGYSLFLTSRAAVFQLDRASGDPGSEQQPRSASIVTMRFLGTSGASAVGGEGLLAAKSNFFLGSDRTRWKTGVSNFASVRYTELYPGIDLVFRISPGKDLEYDFIVKPLADPGIIQFTIEGAETRVDSEGRVSISSKAGTLLHHRPVSFQSFAGRPESVDVQYRKFGTVIGFDVGHYDRTLPLVIDPILSFASFFGMNGNDRGVDVAVGSAGELYLFGQTDSTNFPTRSPYQSNNRGDDDLFISKLGPDGSTVLYSTYLGGSNHEGAGGFKVLYDGSIILAGDTYSTNFPVVNAVQPASRGGPDDLFIARLNPAGDTLIYSTYLGGSANEDFNGLDVDSFESPYVIGNTYSPNFPTVNAFQSTKRVPAGLDSDAFLTKLSTDGTTIEFSTYLGGSAGELGHSVAVATGNGVFVSGGTASTDFPVESPFQIANGGNGDGFVTKFSTEGNILLYSTYLGGSARDSVDVSVADPTGTVYFSGVTSSPDFPLAQPVQPSFGGGPGDLFVAGFNQSGSQLLFSTYYGGNGPDIVADMVRDRRGNIYLVGGTQSTDFPTVRPFQTTFHGGVLDGIILSLTPAADKVRYATYFGGTAPDVFYGVAVNSFGELFATGLTASADLPTKSAYDPTYSGSSDAFFLKLGEPNVYLR